MAKRRKALASLSDALVESVRHITPLDDGVLSTIKLRWLDYVGPQLAEHVTPVGIDGDVLLVAAKTPHWQEGFGEISSSFFKRLRRDIPFIKKHRWCESKTWPQQVLNQKQRTLQSQPDSMTPSKTIEQALERLEASTISMLEES